MIIGVTVLATVIMADRGTASEPGNWPRFRGPLDAGVAPQADPPVQWSETSNIRWKVEVPGHGNSSPIVWGNRVYVLTAVKKDDKIERDPAAAPGQKTDAPNAESRQDSGREERQRGGRGRGRAGRRQEKPSAIHQFVLLAYDRDTGRKVMEVIAREQLPHEGTHPDASQASASPVTDGEVLVASFGSRGIYCYDLDGHPLWNVDLGDMRTRRGFGEGASPAIVGDTVIVVWDHEDQSFIVALDKRTGKERWRKLRDEVTTWATPLVLPHGKSFQAIVPGTNRVRSYDVASGDVIWECAGLGVNCIPTPVAIDDTVITMSGYRDPALLAIRYREARGDITDSASVLWRLDGGTSYVPSPLLYGHRLYFMEKSSSKISCYDARTGKPHYTKARLEGLNGVYASLVGAADRVYVVGRAGTTKVFKNTDQLELLATNTLDDGFNATPAISGNMLFLRGSRYLYCIGEE
jgi:outer membrane protein assembly factor BamB